MISPWRQKYVSNNRKFERTIRKFLPFLYRGFKTRWIEVKPIELTLPNLPVAFDGYRLVHISDIHIGTWMTPERLHGVVKLVNSQKPDLITYSGDYFSYDPHRWKQALSSTLSLLEAKDGKLSVLGNHDYWTGLETVREVAEKSGMP